MRMAHQHLKTATRILAALTALASAAPAAPIDISEAVKTFAPDWQVADCGNHMKPGLRRFWNQRSNVLITHPLDRKIPCTLSRTVTVPATKRPVLVLDVGHHLSSWDWTLVVKADGKELLKKQIGPSTCDNGWLRVVVDLAEYAGKSVKFDLLNLADGWACEGGYWSKIALLDAPPPPDPRKAPAPPLMFQSFLDGPMAGVEEIVFAVRSMGQDGHWYANFGHHVRNADRMMYGPAGGRLCRLNLRNGKVVNLLDDPDGAVRDPQLHYDGKKMIFAYRRGGSRHYHLYEINCDGTDLRQLTDGPYDDYEPTYLPEGDIAFCSSRCNRFVNCWFTQVAILYRCDADGGGIRPLSANIEHDNTPWMLPDGRLLYMRWEYVDRSRVRFHHLWTANPDGTGQMVYYGNMHPGTVMLDAKPIPGSRRVVASFSPGHGRKEHAGHITVVDPRNGPDDRGRAVRISREADWRDPYAFSEDCFMAARRRKLWVMNGTGAAKAIYTLPPELKHLDVHEPRPLRPRKREHVIPSRMNASRTTGRLALADVTRGRNMAGVKRGEIKRLLILETLPKPVNFSGSMEPISLGGTFTLPRILGTVPVEPDGSAYMEVPALRSLFFVALDSNGLSVKRMQSFVSVMPGETVGCIGCHEERTEGPPVRASLMATRRAPSPIEPIEGMPDMFEFPRDIQPILDKHCVQCHNDTQYAGKLLLTSDRGPGTPMPTPRS
jgi:hypothetical protein